MIKSGCGGMYIVALFSARINYFAAITKPTASL